MDKTYHITLGTNQLAFDKYVYFSNTFYEKLKKLGK